MLTFLFITIDKKNIFTRAVNTTESATPTVQERTSKRPIGFPPKQAGIITWPKAKEVVAAAAQ